VWNSEATRPFQPAASVYTFSMTTYSQSLASLTLCLLAAGCAPETINVTNGKDVPAEFARLQDLLSPPDAAGSTEAFDTFVEIIADECRGDEALFHETMLSHFNGKSVQAVLDEYRQLDRAIVAKHAAAVAAKRAKAEAEEAERFNKKLNDEMLQMLDEKIEALDKLEKQSRRQ
jgi:hypothetical protein